MAVLPTNPSESPVRRSRTVDLVNPLFAPAVRVMNRLAYLQKFILIGVLLLIPLVVVISQFLAAVNKDVAFSAKERVGLTYNEPLFALVIAFQRHSALSVAYLSGDGNMLDELTAQQSEIDSIIARMDVIDTRIGEELGLRANWAALKDRWETMRSTSLSLSASQSYQQHIALSRATNTLINDSGNNSNLILDPDIDSYYLMDAVILKLPRTAQFISELSGAVVGTVADPTESIDPSQVSILSGLVRSELESNVRGWNYAFNFTPSLKASIDPTITTSRQNIDALLQQIGQQIMRPVTPPVGAPTLNPPSQPSAGQTPSNASTPALTTDQLITLVNNALLSTQDLYTATSQSLDRLLVKRIQGFEAQRNVVIFTTLIGLAVAIYLLAGFYQSVRGTIKALKRAADRMMAGDLTEEVVLQTQDELGEATVAFNQVAKALNITNTNLQTANRTLEVRRHELEVANVVAKEANRLKSEFLSTMSHELRTPLNAIVGFTDLLLTGKPGPINEMQSTFLERTAGNNRRLLGLINDILDLSRIEAGRMEIYNAPYSAKEMLNFVSAQTSSLFSKKNLKFETNIAPDFAEQVIGDRGRVEQVIVNLLSNAAKFTQEGEVEMKAWMVSEGSFAVAVRDSGRGIPPHLLDAIFDPFRQVEGSTNRQFGGSGLGLAIVRDLVKMMDGNITVQSEVGQGSTFTMTLPVKAGLGEVAA